MSADKRTAGHTGGPSAFSVYASRFLSGKTGAQTNDEQSSQVGDNILLIGHPSGVNTNLELQIFRPPSPSSPSHDPFMQSPSASRSQPYLRGASRSPSPTRTPPFPGPGIGGIPNIQDEDDDVSGLGSGIGVGLLFADPIASSSRNTAPGSSSRRARRPKTTIPNPYAPSSSSDDEIEPDLEEVANVRRTLASKISQQPERAKKGWLAHQSEFPPSSSSSSETDSDKETEPDSEMDERSRMMGISRYQKKKQTQAQRDGEFDGSDALPPYPEASTLNEPLLGPEEMEGRGRTTSLPVRLQVYHGRFGHWQREGLRKYKGASYWLVGCFANDIRKILVSWPSGSRVYSV